MSYPPSQFYSNHLSSAATTSTTAGNHNTHSHVGFSETDDNPQVPTPPDLTKAEFKTVQEVQIPALPKSQLGVVVSSYDKTIGTQFHVFRLV